MTVCSSVSGFESKPVTCALSAIKKRAKARLLMPMPIRATRRPLHRLTSTVVPPYALSCLALPHSAALPPYVPAYVAAAKRVTLFSYRSDSCNGASRTPSSSAPSGTRVRPAPYGPQRFHRLAFHRDRHSFDMGELGQGGHDGMYGQAALLHSRPGWPSCSSLEKSTRAIPPAT